MTVHDRLRQELGRRAAEIDVDAAQNLDQVMATADARLRRTRIMGAAAATVFVVGVTSVALLVRDGDDTTDQVAVSTDDTVAADVIEAEPTDEAASDEQPASPALGDEEIATTEADGDPSTDDLGGEAGSSVDTSDGDTEPGEDAPADDEDDTPDDAAATDDPAQVATSVVTAVVDMQAHNGGFVGLRPGELVFSTDGTTWGAVADPRPGGRGVIVDMASHNGVLYVVGTAGSGASARSWVVASSGLDSWESVDIGEPDDDGSDLTAIVHTPVSVGVGGAGVVVTGETTVHIDVEALLDPAVYESGDWTLGTSTGDLSKLVTYDTDTGAEADVIDLVDAGVPAETIALLERPEPFVATGAGRAVRVVEDDLDRRTVLTHAGVGGTEFLAAGFSREFSSRILWSSPDGVAWTPIPVSVIATPRSDAIGTVADRLVVFTGDGPLMTVQVRAGGDWTEVRLDDLIGNRNDDYVLADASFGPGGVAAAVVTIGESGSEVVHLLTSADGLEWQTATVASFAGGTPGVVDVDSIGMGSTAVAVGLQRSDGTHETMLVPLPIG